MDWNSVGSQLGAVSLLIAGVVWYIRTSEARWKSEREEFLKQISLKDEDNKKNFERVYVLAQTSERTAAELTAAVKGLHP